MFDLTLSEHNINDDDHSNTDNNNSNNNITRIAIGLKIKVH